MRRMAAVVAACLLAGALPGLAAEATGSGAAPPAAGVGAWTAGLPDLDDLDPAVHDYDEAIVSRHVITGRDGLQRIAFDLIRPATDEPVPTIMVSSPYYNTNGRFSYDANGNFVAMRKTPWGSPSNTAGPTTPFPEQYDELFVPRGYAVLLHDLRGTRNSSGCQVYGHRSEAEDAVDIIDWVAEQAWSNGAVGMIGGSYDGTIANGAASMAPAALKAIVPIRAIDRWYDYHHFNGVLSSNFVTPYNFSTVTPLTDVQNSSGEDELYPLHVVERRACAMAIGPTVGTQYANPVANSTDAFWSARDYVQDAGAITAAVWIVHGLDDTNVKPMNASYLWDALPAEVPRRLWWLRGAHDNPHNPALRFPVNEIFESELHRWFAQHLKGLAAGVEDTPAVVVQAEDGELVPAPSWPAPSQDRSFWLTPSGLSEEQPAEGARLTYTDRPAGGTTITLESDPLTSDLRISGEAFMELVYALPSGGDTTFAYALQHRGDGPTRTITRGYARGGFRGEINARGISYPTIPAPHLPGETSTISFPFWAADYVVPAGSTLAVVIAANDGLVQGGGNGTTELLVGLSRLVVPDAVDRATPAQPAG
jgi:X-Pro dipeptidyl-peptidase